MFEYLRSIFALYDNARVDLCDAVKEEPFDGKGSERKEKKKKDGQRAKEREGGEKRHRRDGRVEPQVSQDRVPYRSFQRTSLILLPPPSSIRRRVPSPPPLSFFSSPPFASALVSNRARSPLCLLRSFFHCRARLVKRLRANTWAWITVVKRRYSMATILWSPCAMRHGPRPRAASFNIFSPYARVYVCLTGDVSSSSLVSWWVGLNW